jgi:hypothetical protein
MDTLSHYQGQAAIAELARWQGAGLTPQPGCKLAEVSLGDATAWIEYEFTPGRAGRYYGEPEHCYPDEPPEIAILNVLINGVMCDASDVIPAAVIERWEQQIYEAECEAAQDFGDSRDDYDASDDYLADRAADKYERELDARASQ